MKTCKPKTNWIIDAVLFVGFLAAFFLDLTGLALHQWLGVALVALSGYHFLVHLGWVEAVTLRFIKGTSGQARACYIIDAALMLGFYLILLTGLVISTWLELPLENYLAWMNIHIIVSIITLILVSLKIAMHWRWIVTVANKHIFANPTPVKGGLSARPAAASASNSRRDFLKLMGFVSVATVVATGSALRGVSGPPEEDTEADLATNDDSSKAGPATAPQMIVPTATQVSTPEQMVLPTAAPVSAPEQMALPTATPVPTVPMPEEPVVSCTVRCSNHCSYPGRCRRYVDANQNNLCDRGECL